MAWNGFGNRELSDVQEAGPPMLQPGTHIVRAKDARVGDVQGTLNKKLLEAEDGTGQLIETFNIHHTSTQATEIGLSSRASSSLPGTRTQAAPATSPR